VFLSDGDAGEYSIEEGEERPRRALIARRRKADMGIRTQDLLFTKRRLIAP
jgi:hypothetical protein